MKTPHDRLRALLRPVVVWKSEDIPPRRLFTVAKEQNPGCRKLNVDVWKPLQLALAVDADLAAYVDEFTQRAWQRFSTSPKLCTGDTARAQTILDQACWEIWEAVGDGWTVPVWEL